MWCEEVEEAKGDAGHVFIVERAGGVNERRGKARRGAGRRGQRQKTDGHGFGKWWGRVTGFSLDWWLDFPPSPFSSHQSALPFCLSAQSPTADWLRGKASMCNPSSCSIQCKAKQKGPAVGLATHLRLRRVDLVAKLQYLAAPQRTTIAHRASLEASWCVRTIATTTTTSTTTTLDIHADHVSSAEACIKIERPTRRCDTMPCLANELPLQ